jgi:hypothetical protein
MENHSVQGKMVWIRKVMAFKSVRVLLMIGFFLFVYQIIYAMGVFFAINTMVLSMWLCWLAMFVIFVSILPVRNALFYVEVADTILPKPSTTSGTTSDASSGTTSEGGSGTTSERQAAISGTNATGPTVQSTSQALAITS